MLIERKKMKKILIVCEQRFFLLVILNLALYRAKNVACTDFLSSTSNLLFTVGKIINQYI